MDIGSALVTDPQAAKRVEDGHALLHHPTMAAEPLGGVDAWPGDARSNATLAQLVAVGPRGVGLVAVQLAGSPPGTALAPAHRGYGIHQRQQLSPIGHVGCRQALRQRVAFAVDEKMVLAARLRAIRWIRPR